MIKTTDDVWKKRAIILGFLLTIVVVISIGYILSIEYKEEIEQKSYEELAAYQTNNNVIILHDGNDIIEYNILDVCEVMLE